MEEKQNTIVSYNHTIHIISKVIVHTIKENGSQVFPMDME